MSVLRGDNRSLGIPALTDAFVFQLLFLCSRLESCESPTTRDDLDDRKANLLFRDTEGNAVTIPGLIGDDLYTMYDWNFTTVPQDFLDNQTRPYNAGRVVGGGSILNGLVWTRGSSADYDAWETLNNPGWGWNGLLPYFMKVGWEWIILLARCHHTVYCCTSD